MHVCSLKCKAGIRIFGLTRTVPFNSGIVAVAQWLKGRRTYFDNCVSQHLSGAGWSPAGSVGRDFNLQKLNYQSRGGGGGG